MIYLFNQLEELIDVIDEASLAEFTHTIELNQFDRSSFEIPVDYKPDIIKEAQFFGFQSRDRAFCLFRISEKSYDISLTIEGIDRAESDLHSFIIEDKRPGGTADQVLSGILEGTGYQLGDTNRLIVNGKLSFYYISVRQALVKIIESYGCEFQVRYTFVENKIIGRYIDLYQRFGRKTGHQFEYGSNILNVTYEESSDEVVTALIGRGRGEQSTDDTGEATGGYGRRIQFKDVVWAVAKGDPVDKPAGQNYVANEAARNNYGLHQNGVIKHRFGVYTNENIEDPVELLKATYKELQRLSVPIATFKANLLDLANAIEQDIWIGDSIGIVRDQIGIAFEARIHKLVIDKLDDNRSVAELGDYQTLQAKDRTTRQQAIIDAVSGFSESLIEKAIADEVERRDKEFDEKMRISKLEFDNALEGVKAKAEETKEEIFESIAGSFESFRENLSNSVQVLADKALEKAGASSLLAQEAKRIGLDSITKLEEFKRQATNAQTALSGDLDALKRTIANDIRPKQEQVTAEIAKQVKALGQTRDELLGIKSAQATYEETTTRRLSELTNLANGKASKSELTQTAEELASKIASVQASGRNLFLNSLFKQDISKTGVWTTSTYEATIDSENKYLGHNALKIVGQNPSGRDSGNPKVTYPAFGQYGKNVPGSTTNQDVTISFYAKANKNGIMLRSRLGNIGYKNGNVILSTEIKRYVVHIPKSWTNESRQTTNEWLFNFNQEGTVWIWMPKFEISDVDTSYSEAPEDIEGQISAVESNFKQRADSLDAGVSRLTEGLRTKADISSLNVAAENIRQSVKSLETNTQNKLDQKLSLAEFEVRAGSIRQEILNATKDKADKTLVIAEAGKLREEFSNLRVGGRNLLKGSKGPFKPDKNPANFDNQVLYHNETSIHLVQNEKYRISAKTDGIFDSQHNSSKESDNVVLWLMDKAVTQYQIVSDAKTGTTGTEFVWSRPTGTYHLRVNTYRKDPEKLKSVWEVKVEQGSFKTDWSPAPEDTEGLITEAKATFERTAQGLRTDLSAIQEYVNKDGQQQEALQRYTREESARQATAVRELVARDYVGKSTYQEDVRGLERRFEAITNPQNGSIATQISKYKTAVDGRFTEITSMLSGKANQVDFQRVQETSKLYERILGNTDNGIADNVARMAMTNQLFQVEVSKVFENHRNLFLSSTATKGYLGNAGIIYVANSTQKEITSDFISVEPNENIIFQHWVTLPENGMAWTAWQFFDKNKNPIDNRKPGLNAYKTTTGKQHNINQITVPANAYFVRFSARMYNDGLIKIEPGSIPSDYSVAPEDTDEAIRTVQSQLAGSWAVQTLTSAGSIVSQINATNNQILIEAEKIRLKGKTLLDELTAIQGYFKRLFVGEGTFATLNADVIRTNSITADKLVMDMAMARRFVSSDLFTDTLAAKEAFINKLRSVVVTATLLEGYRGRIGGFQIGTHDNDPSSFWLTGLDQFKVGMSNGRGREFQTAFWANWGNTWGKPGPLSWYVTLDGQMYCNNDATFHRIVDFSSTCSVNFYGANSFYKDIYMRGGTEIFGTGSTPRAGGKNSVVWWNQVGDGSLKYHIDMASDKRLKENIVDSNIVALDKIKQLKMKSFDFIRTGKHEEVGLIAQEVETILPSVISKNPEKEDDYLHIDYVAIVPYLIKSIQELNQKIEEMEKTVA